MTQRASATQLADRLRKARLLADIKAGAMATALQVDRKTVWNWENGKHAPSDSELRRWAELTNMPLGWFTAPSISDYMRQVIVGEAPIPTEFGTAIAEQLRADREGRGAEHLEARLRQLEAEGKLTAEQVAMALGASGQATRTSPWIVSRSTRREQLLPAA